MDTMDLDHPATNGKAESDSRQAETEVKMGLPALLKRLNRHRKDHLLNAKNTKEVEDDKRTNTERLEDYLRTSGLEKRIIRQVEYYFGDHNLPKDRFMREVLEDNRGWIPMEIMVTFKRLAELSKDADFIMSALDKSVNRIVQVDFAGRQLRRHPENPLPEMDEGKRQEVQERTLYVGGFDRDRTTLDELLEFFEGGFDKVCNVWMRYRKNPSTKNQNNSPPPEQDDRQFLGSVFVTFGTLQAAKDFLRKVNNSEEGCMKYKGRKLTAKYQREFLDSRLEDNDEFVAFKAGRTLFVQGFDKMETEDGELGDFFGLFDDAETVRKRVYRNNASKEDDEGLWCFTGSVFVCFGTEKGAQNFYNRHLKTPVTYKGDKLIVKWQVDFYEQKGKFKRHVQRWREEQQKNCN